MSNINNVHVSGDVIKESELSDSLVEILVRIGSEEAPIPISTIISKEKWEKFKNDFPDKYKSVTISGQLQAYRDLSDGTTKYSIKAIDGGAVTCFHNHLQDNLDETLNQFHGNVVLEKKFDFNISSNLLLKRMVFKTITPSHPAYFEAVALRGAAPFFENLEEGQEMFLKANFVKDSNGNLPYWRIKHRPYITHNR